AHHSSLRAMKMRLEDLFPNGFLCAREGESHRMMRHDLQNALRRLPEESASCLGDSLRTIAASELSRYQRQGCSAAEPAAVYADAMLSMATSMLITMSFGLAPGSADHLRLCSLYRRLSTANVVWNPGSREVSAFAALRAFVESLAETCASGSARISGRSLLLACQESGSLDESMIGNLIYQLETGRHDMKNLFRWLTFHTSRNPDLLARIAQERLRAEGSQPLARAVVWETLRHDQSERLMRSVEADIVHEGHLIPRHSIVRLCLWESHHDESVFADPHRFDPDRFLAGSPGKDDFAPFGLDHHQCPMGSHVLLMGAVFLAELSRYRLTPFHAEGSRRGLFHWEPPKNFFVQLLPGDRTAQAAD
ncbi:MAG: cytochrome P450, partial [Synechococcaceae cyanobacterium]|nr:cytochrome P450 [Synechococcaceae cyanobacterium]